MISIKDAFKCLFNKKLCKESNRLLEIDQNGILVNLFFDYDAEQQEIEVLDTLIMGTNKNRYNYLFCNNNSYLIHFFICRSLKISRKIFEKDFFPKNLNLTECEKVLPVPPRNVSSQIKLSSCTVTGPTVFIAGRYRKLSRNLSQTPWILNGKRMKEGSIQETITFVLSPFFGNLNESHKVVFMSSGREDIDVRTLGNGRPFAVQINDAQKCSLPAFSAIEMELQIERTKEVSVHLLQIVNR